MLWPFSITWTDYHKSIHFRPLSLSIFWLPDKDFHIKPEIKFEKCDRPTYWGWRWNLKILLVQITWH